MENKNRAVQMIDRDGNFKAAELDQFVRTSGLSNCGNSYAVVAILGPQSSGKSTLFNNLFYTNFKVMDAYKGRIQTTQGIWLAKAKCDAKEEKPFIVAMDLEGADGRERGPDDTAFEKQSALFALVIADIVMINMWCKDIGRDQGACKPLLRTVFEVMMRIFSVRKTTLLFVIRDQTKTPLKILERDLREDIEQIWNSVCKPTIHVNTPLSKFFNVEVIALSSFEDYEQQFKQQVAELRQLLLNRIEYGQGIAPASEFSSIAEQMWIKIKNNQDLNLPSQKVLFATIRCEEIANQKLQLLYNDEHLVALEEHFQFGRPISGFGSKLSSILERYFSEYDEEVRYFDEGVRIEKRKQLVLKALDFVHPVYLKLLNHLRSEAFESFKHQLEERLNKGEGFSASAKLCSNSAMSKFNHRSADAAIRQGNWDASDIRLTLRQDISNEILSQWKVLYKKQFDGALSEQLKSLFQSAYDDTWVKVRELLTREIDHMSASISGFELDLDLPKRNKLVQEMRDYARNVVVIKAREAVANYDVYLQIMRNRFAANYDVYLRNRFETSIEKDKIIKIVSIESLKVLSVMAAIRLEDKSDEIEETLLSLVDKERGPSEILFSKQWPEISPENTLISPYRCVTLVISFLKDIDHKYFKASRMDKFKQLLKFLVLFAQLLIRSFGISPARNNEENAGSHFHQNTNDEGEMESWSKEHLGKMISKESFKEERIDRKNIVEDSDSDEDFDESSSFLDKYVDESSSISQYATRSEPDMSDKEELGSKLDFDVHDHNIEKCEEEFIRKSWAELQPERSRISSISLVNQDGSTYSLSPCIFRTPFPGLRFQAPKLVSIGPYHSGKNLPLDKYKYSFLDKFLSRTRNQGKDLGFYVQQLMALEWRTRSCYSNSKELFMASPDFLEMIVVDACFIMEVICHFGKSEELAHKDKSFLVPIEPWQIPILVQDLLILENQMPFFVLDKLFELSDDGSEEGTGTVSLIAMALKFFDLAFPIPLDFAPKFNHMEVPKPKHLLDLFLQTIRPSNPSNNSLSLFSKTYQLIAMTLFNILNYPLLKYTNRRNTVLVPRTEDVGLPEGPKPSTPETAKLKKVHVLGSASELRKSGIRFRPRITERFTDIDFRDGVLEIPPITINDLFMTIMVNCVALEHHYSSSGSGCPKNLTAYACFMSDLIRYPADVECLTSDGIISRFSHQSKKVWSFFSDLRSKISDMDILLQDCFLSKTAMEIDKHYSTSRGTGGVTWLRSFQRDPSMVLFCITTLCFSFYFLQLKTDTWFY